MIYGNKEIYPRVDILRDCRVSLDEMYNLQLKQYEDDGFVLETVFYKDENDAFTIYGWRIHDTDKAKLEDYYKRNSVRV